MRISPAGPRQLLDLRRARLPVRRGQPVETAPVEDEVVRAGQRKVVKSGDVASSEPHRNPGGSSSLAGGAQRAGHAIDTRDLPPVLGQVDAVRAGATPEIEGAPWRVACFDQFPQRRTRRARAQLYRRGCHPVRRVSARDRQSRAGFNLKSQP